MIETEQTVSNGEGQRTRGPKQANEFQSVLLAMAGHDLRQPLQAIMSSYEWLARRLATSSEQEYLRRGRVAITRLSEQLDLLVEALRLHELSAKIRLSPVLLAPILVRLCDESQESAGRKGVTLHVRRPIAAVMSDALLLEGVLRNLIRNAIKYTPGGGRVLVGCRRRGRTVKIEVYDTGVGIAPEKLSQVFEAFQRLDSGQADGLGLGLFVVRRAIDLLGHTIEVRSGVDAGTCFSVVAETGDPPRDWESAGMSTSGAQWRKKALTPRRS
jgi:two-component system, OmpR family, phosphate regulon sensor histidine kinase PhoR